MNIQMKSCRGSRRFTLLEMLIAMTVLVILAMIMFEIVNRARQAWSSMQANTRIYENARIVFEVIGRDLQSAVASDESGREIPFYIWHPDNDDELLSFVSVTRMVVDENDPPESDLSEIAYYHTDDENAAEEPYRFFRSITQDNNTGWDFYDNRGGGWENTSEDFHEVISGVEDISILCIDAGDSIMNVGETTTLPRTVQVSITLFDPRAMKLEGAPRERMIDRTRRTFNKMIYLRAEGF